MNDSMHYNLQVLLVIVFMLNRKEWLEFQSYLYDNSLITIFLPFAFGFKEFDGVLVVL